MTNAFNHDWKSNSATLFHMRSVIANYNLNVIEVAHWSEDSENKTFPSFSCIHLESTDIMLVTIVHPHFKKVVTNFFVDFYIYNLT